MAMAMVATVSAPTAARIDASLGATVVPSPMRVVHLGQSALVLREESAAARRNAQRGALFTITDRAGGVTPGGVCIPNPTEFARIRADIAHIDPTALVDLSAWWVRTVLETVDLRVNPRDLDTAMSRTSIRAVAEALAAETPPTSATSAAFDGGLARVRSRAGDLATAALALDSAAILGDIIGAGPGTTPTGDDMVAGCLAALAILGRTTAAHHLARAMAPLLESTTTTSRHYLRAAASGHFAEHVHHLIAGFSADHSADRMLAHARHWGATSGIDLLIGMTATLRAEAAARTEEDAA
jgi:hypothetical protein